MRKFISISLLLTTSFLHAGKCQTQREIYIENATTTVWKTTICPGERLPFHTHQTPRVVIPEENVKLQVVYRSGKKQNFKLEKLMPVYLSVGQGKESHQDVNLSNKIIRLTVIEFKKAKS